jgi:hypothetical protein
MYVEAPHGGSEWQEEWQKTVLHLPPGGDLLAVMPPRSPLTVPHAASPLCLDGATLLSQF